MGWGSSTFHAKGWWPKSSCPPLKVCLPWVRQRGIWDVPRILPGCPGPLVESPQLWVWAQLPFGGPSDWRRDPFPPATAPPSPPSLPLPPPRWPFLQCSVRGVAAWPGGGGTRGVELEGPPSGTWGQTHIWGHSTWGCSKSLCKRKVHALSSFPTNGAFERRIHDYFGMPEAPRWLLASLASYPEGLRRSQPARLSNKGIEMVCASNLSCSALECHAEGSTTKGGAAQKRFLKFWCKSVQIWAFWPATSAKEKQRNTHTHTHTHTRTHTHTQTTQKCTKTCNFAKMLATPHPLLLHLVSVHNLSFEQDCDWQHCSCSLQHPFAALYLVES